MAKGRALQEFYVFILDAANNYYIATYDNVGNPFIQKSSPYPLRVNPSNLKEFKPSFGTNKTYMSGVRSVTNIFSFVEDGADILRSFDYTGSGYSQELYIKIIRYNYADGIYYLYYEGRFDFKTKLDKPKESFSINVVDSGVWATLSQNDSVDYNIDCSPSNPTAIPVLMDGITLRAKYTYQTVPSAFDVINPVVGFDGNPFALVLVNTDGDSAGVITSNEHYTQNPIVTPDDNNYIFKCADETSIRLFGTFTFKIKSETSNNVIITLKVRLSLTDFFDLGTASTHVTDEFGSNLLITFDESYDLKAGEEVRLVLHVSYPSGDSEDWTILPSISNIYITTDTKLANSICYAIRPLDLGQQIVSKATNNKFTLRSDFLALNNKLVATCGNALRNAPNAYITSSFEDWFKTYDLQYWIAFRIIDGQMFIEQFKTIYDDTTNLFDIGEVQELSLEVADDYLFNEISVGSPKQDYRHTSGRLEFNSTNKFSVPQFNVKKNLDLISPYRLDGYGAEFIRLDYQQQSSEDNSGDSETFLLDITDQKSTQGVEVENFVDITVNTLPLAPIIMYPFNNDTIYNNKPTIRGRCAPLTEVFVYADGSLDGSVISDANGEWRYDIQTALDYYEQDVTDGVHLIETTFTDLTGTLESRTVILVDADVVTRIANLLDGDSIYNNKPILNGVAEAELELQVFLDAFLIGTTTADGSGRWFFQMPIMSNGTHTVQVGTAFISFVVNAFTSVPLITSFADGFQIVNNLPLVEGVGIPGTKVDLYLDYYEAVSIGTTFVSPTGNWSIQLVELFKDDGVTVLTPIPEGDHIISTSLQILSAIVSITGYTLNRPDYDYVSGVLDQTIFNTELSPQMILRARMSFFKSVFYQQPNTVIKFESGDKNQQFSRTIDGVTIKENDDVTIATHNSAEEQPVFLPILLKAKVKTPLSFFETMNNFSNGGLIKSSYKGFDLYALPIGEMTVNDITNELQDWNLLLSVKTPLVTLLKLSSSGSTFKLMDKAIYRSDYNMLHMVKYDYQKPAQFSAAELYEDWFENRNQDWRNNPVYIQKIQHSEGEVRDQIITSGVAGDIFLNMYKCSDASLVQSYQYQPVTPAPIPAPDVVKEVVIDYSAIAAGDYFFVMYINDIPITISERIRVAVQHEGTILIRATNDKNKIGAMFSTGFESVIRVEGMLKKLMPVLENITNEDEVGNYEMIHSVSTKKRNVLIGDPKGTPDYLYLKIPPILSLDNVQIEQLNYVIDKTASFEPQDQVQGYPMYHFSIDMMLKDNNEGFTFSSGDAGFTSSVILIIDPTAIGTGGSGLTQIELTNE